MDILPNTVPGITIATIVTPLLLITNAGTPPILTEVGLLKLVPVIFINEPTGPF